MERTHFLLLLHAALLRFKVTDDRKRFRSPPVQQRRARVAGSLSALAPSAERASSNLKLGVDLTFLGGIEATECSYGVNVEGAVYQRCASRGCDDTAVSPRRRDA